MLIHTRAALEFIEKNNLVSWCWSFPEMPMVRDKPDPVWVAKWGVTVHTDHPIDLRQLAELLQH